jgi:hypothetical protein
MTCLRSAQRPAIDVGGWTGPTVIAQNRDMGLLRLFKGHETWILLAENEVYVLHIYYGLRVLLRHRCLVSNNCPRRQLAMLSKYDGFLGSDITDEFFSI